MIRALVVCLLVLAGAPSLSSAASTRVDSLVAEGYAMVREEHPRRAVAAFEAVLAEAPHRVDEISGALAYQYAWAGRLGDARREFHRAIALHPEDHDLRLGRLLVLNWMGMHLQAWRGYEDLYRRDVTDPRPVVGMATAMNWAGRLDLASRTLESVEAMNPGNVDAANLRISIRRARRPLAGLYHDYSEDSDGFRVNGAWLEGVVSPGPQWTLVPFANRLGIRRSGFAPIDETWLGVRVVGRPATRLGVRGRAARIAERPRGSTFSPWVGDFSLEATASDQLRFSVYGEQFAVVSYATYPDRITGRVTGGTATWRPDWLTEVHGSLDYADYSDNNSRWNLWLTGNREVYVPLRLHVGALARYLDFARWLDNGIWTPENYWASAATVRAELGPRDRWSVSLGAEVGPSHESGGDVVLYASYWVGAFTAAGPWLIEARVGHSEGNATGSGYDRTYTHLGLRYRF